MGTAPIAVLIPTMNRPKALQRTLASYFAASVVPAEIIIVDQSVDLQTIEENRMIVESYCTKTIAKYYHSSDQSCTKARNYAEDHATQEILVFCDDDVDVYPDTIATIANMMQDKELALIAGINDNSLNNKQSVLGYLTGMRSYKKRGMGHITAALFGRFPLQVVGEVPIEWAMGFFYVMRKSLIDKWNIRWDENLTSYAYAEDLDFSMTYCKCAQKEGLRCVISDRVHVVHLATNEYRIPSRKSTFMNVINRAYLCQKHQLGKRCELAMDWSNICRLAERLVKRQQPKDLADAMKVAKQQRQKIKEGHLADLYG